MCVSMGERPATVAWVSCRPTTFWGQPHGAVRDEVSTSADMLALPTSENEGDLTTIMHELRQSNHTISPMKYNMVPTLHEPNGLLR